MYRVWGRREMYTNFEKSKKFEIAQFLKGGTKFSLLE
jgi:hypothetical protein